MGSRSDRPFYLLPSEYDIPYFYECHPKIDHLRNILITSLLLIASTGCNKNEFEFECMDRPVLQSGDLYVSDAYVLRSGAGRAEYSPDGTQISYHALGNDGYYDCYLMNSDGTAPQCITCNASGFPGKHAGQPSWHPSGAFIAFQAEKESYYLDGNAALAHPGIGFNNDVYIMTADGSQVWQITDLDTKQSLLDNTPFTGVLHPHFNNAGDKISWAERVNNGGEWGEWELILADFAIENNQPVVSNISRHQPGQQHLYYETNDFSADDSKLIICGNLQADQREIGMDLYEFDVNTYELTALSHSFCDWDESGHYSPDGNWIAFIGSEGYTPGSSKKWYEWGKAEFWLMRTDGSKKYPITAYNCPDSEDFVGKRVMPAYITWGLDGTSLLAGIVIEQDNGDLVDELRVLELSTF